MKRRAPVRKHSRHLVVKHHQPRRIWLFRLGLVAAVLVSLWGAFFYGEYRVGFDRRELMDMQDKLAESEKHNQALNDEITVLQRQREVDETAHQQAQGAMEDLQKKLTETQEELGFYKGIVSPAAGEEGVRVQSLRFSNGGAPRLYHYRLVLMQARTRELRVSGNVGMKIYGVQDGKPVMLDARELAPQGSHPNFGFALQYFENLEGDAFLPAGFQPGRVEVTVQENGQQPVQQNFDWNSVIS